MFDEAHSENIELDPDAVCEGNASQKEGKTSRGNQKVVRNVLKHSNSVGRASRKHKVRGYAYDMAGHTRASVDRYLELAGKPVSSLQPVATPFLDYHSWQIEGRVSQDRAQSVTRATV